jgi:putative transcriptional regulator
MTPRHHLSEALVLAWSTGEACEATRLVCASHLTLCPACRARVTELESIGGELLHSIEPVPTMADGLAELFGRIDRGEQESPVEATPSGDLDWVLPGDHPLPRPIAAYIEPGARWESVVPGKVEQLTLPLRLGDHPVRLTRVKPGFHVPRHTHQGLDLKLVLSGGYHDEENEFNRGDLAINDEELTHSLSIDPGEDCVILAVNEAPLKPVGVKAKLANWLVGGF